MGSAREGPHSTGFIAVHPLGGIALAIQATGQLEVPVTERETADRRIAPAPLVVLHPQSDAVGSRCEASQTERRLFETGRQRPRLSQGQSATKSLSRVIANKILGRDKRCGLRIGSRERCNYPEQPTSEQAGKPVHTIGEGKGTHGALTAWPSLRMTSVSTPSRTMSGDRSKEITTGFSVVQPSGSIHGPPEGPMVLRLPSRLL